MSSCAPEESEHDWNHNEDDEDSEVEEGLDMLTGSPCDWPEIFAAVADVQWPALTASRLHMATLSSGTDSPVVAMQQIARTSAVHHTMSCKSASSAQVFILDNFKPDHFFLDIRQLHKTNKLPCVMCAGRGTRFCSGHRDPQHLVAAGSPCPPYSIQNPNRFRVDFRTHADIQVFVAVRDFLESEPPEAAVLENVGRVCKSSRRKDQKVNPNTYDTPADFIMNGKLPDSRGNLREVCLASLKSFLVLVCPIL